MNPKLAKTIRIIAIIFLTLTALQNLMGGAVTVCAAFFTEEYEMYELLDYNWLYQILMIFTIAIGVANIWSVVQLAKRKKKSYRNALIILVIGTILAAIQVYASLILRGKAVPANMKLYINVITLVIFLVLGTPGLKQKVGWEKDAAAGENNIAGGTAAIIGSALTFTVFFWAGPSHTLRGNNWVYEFETLLLTTGTLLLIGGIIMLGREISRRLGIKRNKTVEVH